MESFQIDRMSDKIQNIEMPHENFQFATSTKLVQSLLENEKLYILGILNEHYL